MLYRIGRRGVPGGERGGRARDRSGGFGLSPQAMDRQKKMYEIPAPPSRFSPPLE